MWSAYLEMIRIKFLMMLAYRVNYYSGILVYSINIGAYYFLWNAVYASKIGSGATMGGLSAVQMTTYIAISWMARAFYFNNLDREIATEIRDGTVVVELLRPYHYLVIKIMQAFGEGLFRFLFFMIPGMVLAVFLFPVQLPKHASAWGWFLVSIVLSFILNSMLNMLTGLSSFFIFNNQGLIRAKRILVDLLSGLFLPLSYYPLWAQKIMNDLPFQGISYLPNLLFTGVLHGHAAWLAIGRQMLWIAIFLVILQIVWRKAARSLTVQGG
ncbi:ABC-2 family transporter protein [Fodinisporobacter ferrooxydans]|uniref:ABC-2 family transporter protein n=1 Tax=Fodinisporobacter ferrooxydans TaxID=2901836 RepID=A0ABY4CHD2_9BACL|nr:ABC-2 family transporter protein [Alicyclobacillaceae bacterium MYW30-H2]